MATTIHPVQHLEEEIPLAPHDVPLDLVVTPRRAAATEVSRERPPGIDWNALIEEKIRAISLLQRLREEREAAG